MLITGTALVWYDDQEYELAEGGIVFLPKGTPHGYRITSKKADLLMINAPAGIEGMFRARRPRQVRATARASSSRRPRRWPKVPRSSGTSSSDRRANADCPRAIATNACHSRAAGPLHVQNMRKDSELVAFELDPQVAKALAPIATGLAGLTPPPVGDVAGRRAAMNAMLADVDRLQPAAGDVRIADHEVTTADGARLPLRWYSTSTSGDGDGDGDGRAAGPAVLYLHGGGMILGSVAINDGAVSRYASRSGVPFLAVDYRLAPEHPFPAALEDVYAGLQWLHEHACDLGVDPSRIAVMGDSGGGGLAAGVSILARDRGGPAIARQVLLFPMLDDRTTTPDPQIVPVRRLDLRRQRHRVERDPRRPRRRPGRAGRPPPPHGSRTRAACRPLISKPASSTSSVTRT